MIDLSKNYSLEVKINKGDLQGLDKEGLSRHVGTSRFLFARYNPISKKYVTGLDPTAKEVLSLPVKEREKKIQEIKEVKDELEAFLGLPGILDASPKIDTYGNPIPCFWDEFGVTVTTGQNKETYIELEGKVFNLSPSENPLHKLAVIMLDANDYLPKSRKDAGDPRYKSAQFLLTTNDEVEKDSKETVRKEIARGAELHKLFGDKINYERAWEIAYYMGLKPKRGVGEAKLQEDLFMATKEPHYLDLFLKACSLDNEDILTANIFKQAVALDLIRYDGAIKLYTFGATNLRDTEDKSIEYLKTPGLATPMAQLREAVNKRKAKVKNLA